LETQVNNTNAVLREVKGRTNNNTAEPSSASARVTHRPPEKEVTPPGEGKVKLYSVAMEGKTKQKRFKLTVNSKTTKQQIK
jgi:hypothetical protein